MKWLEAIGSYTLAVIFALIVTFGLPAGEHQAPTMIEVMLTLLSTGLLGLGVYLTIMVLVTDFYSNTSIGNRHP